MLWTVIVIALGAMVIAAVAFRPGGAHTVAEIATHSAVIHGELGRLIVALNTANSERDPEYERALARAGEHRKVILADAARVLAEAPDGLFSLRHSILLAVSALRDPAALDLLSKVALNPQPLPPRERPVPGTHEVEDAVQGQMLALDALDGLVALADDGHEAAVDVLVEAVGVASNAIRGAALTALADRPERRAHLQRALAALPTELHFLAGLRRAQVAEVPQIRDPRLHLAGEEIGGTAAPSIEGDAPHQAGPTIGGAPIVFRR